MRSPTCTSIASVVILFSLGLLTAAGSPAWAQSSELDGRWVLGETDDPPELLLEVAGGVITATWLRGDRLPLSRTVVPDPAPPVFRLVSADESDIIHWVRRSETRALAWESGSSELLAAYRLSPVSQELQGGWILEQPGRGTGRLTLTADHASMTAPTGDVEEVSASAVDCSSTALCLFVHNPELAQIILFEPVADQTYLAHPKDDDDFIAVYREGSRPAWLDEYQPDAGEGAAEPPPTPPPSE